MATGTSKMSLLEGVTGSDDIERVINHFELLAHLQKWQKTETQQRNEVEIDEWLHYFAHPLQKSAIDLNPTITDAQKDDEIFRAFGTHFTEKPGVFRRRPARRMQHPGEKLTDSQGDLQCFAMKANPEEPNAIRDHLVVREPFGRIHESQDKLDLRKKSRRRRVNNRDSFRKGTIF